MQSFAEHDVQKGTLHIFATVQADYDRLVQRNQALDVLCDQDLQSTLANIVGDETDEKIYTPFLLIRNQSEREIFHPHDINSAGGRQQPQNDMGIFSNVDDSPFGFDLDIDGLMGGTVDLEDLERDHFDSAAFEASQMKQMSRASGPTDTLESMPTSRYAECLNEDTMKYLMSQDLEKYCHLYSQLLVLEPQATQPLVVKLLDESEASIFTSKSLSRLTLAHFKSLTGQERANRLGDLVQRFVSDPLRNWAVARDMSPDVKAELMRNICSLMDLGTRRSTQNDDMAVTFVLSAQKLKNEIEAVTGMGFNRFQSRKDYWSVVAFFVHAVLTIWRKEVDELGLERVEAAHGGQVLRETADLALEFGVEVFDPRLVSDENIMQFLSFLMRKYIYEFQEYELRERSVAKFVAVLDAFFNSTAEQAVLVLCLNRFGIQDLLDRAVMASFNSATFHCVSTNAELGTLFIGSCSDDVFEKILQRFEKTVWENMMNRFVAQFATHARSFRIVEKTREPTATQSTVEDMDIDM